MFAFKYALKSLSRRKAKNFALVLAISIGVTMLVAVQIASEGVNNVYAKASLDGLGKGDIQISNPNNEIGLLPSSVVEKIKEIDGFPLDDINYITPKIRYKLPIYDPVSSRFERSVFATGILPNVTGFDPFYDIQGQEIPPVEKLTSNLSNPIMVSSSLMRTLDLEVGDQLITSLPDGTGNFTQIILTVADIYDGSRGRGLEGVFSPFTTDLQFYAHVSVFQRLLNANFTNNVNVIEISIADNVIDRSVEFFDPSADTFPGIEKVEDILELLQDEFPQLSIRSPRIELLDTIDVQLEQFTITLDVFIILINLTALLLIINVQSMSIDDRINQIAVLRAMGSRKRTIIKIFIYETIIIGIFGALIAIALGQEMGEWIQQTINEIFGLSGIPPVIKPTTVISAIIWGVLLATLTAIAPALRVSDIPVSETLRGIVSQGSEVSRSKIRLLGVVFILVASGMLYFMGEFWTQEVLNSFDNQLIITIAIEIFLSGFFIITALHIHHRLSLTLWGSSFIVLALYNMNYNYDLVINPLLINLVNWFLAMLFFTLIGTIVVIAVNFDVLMKFLEKILFLFKGPRATIQVSVSQLIDKRFRMILIFSILTLIMVISLFFSTLAESERVGLERQFEYRSQGINIVADVQAPIPGIEQALSEIEGVEQVFAFKKSGLIFYSDDPSSQYFNPQQDAVFAKSVVEVSEEVLKPNAIWDDESFVPSVIGVDDNTEYDYDPSFSEEKVIDLSQQIFDDFFGLEEIQKPVIHTDDDGNEIQGEEQSGNMVIGDYLTGFDNQLIDRMIYLQGMEAPIPVGQQAGVVDMMGDPIGFGNVVLVTPQMASQLPSFQGTPFSNLFLIRTGVSYFDDESNQEIAERIETTLNSINPQENPLCKTQGCVLAGISTRLVHQQYKQFFELDSQTWEFFSLFSFFALIIGVVGMIIISIRSVGERTREIGMRRAIGFSKRGIVFTLALELFIVVFLGIILGVVNTIINVQFFALVAYQTEAVYPMESIVLNIGLIFFSSLFAGIIPAYRASRIPPSQALRYTG